MTDNPARSLQSGPKVNPFVLALGCLYFAAVPFLPLRTILVGPTHVVNWLGLVFAGAALVFWQFRRVASDRAWLTASGILLVSCGIGFLRAPEFARQSVILWLQRFFLPWLVVSLSPLDKRFLRSLCASWLAGLCFTGAWQLYTTARADFVATEYSQYSYSRLLQSGEEWDLAMRMGIYNTHGCMAMSVAAACAFVHTLSCKRMTHKLVFGFCAIFLIFSEWHGRFIASDLLAALGVILVFPVAYYRSKSGLTTALIGLGITILLAIGVVYFADLSVDSTAARINTLLDDGLRADASISARYDLLSVSVGSWLSSPLIGVGLVGWTPDSYDLVGMHNSIVDVPAQLGIIGFLGYYGLIFFPLKRAIAVLRMRGCAILDRETARVVFIGMALFFVSTIINPPFMMALISETLLLLAALGTTLTSRMVQVGGRSDPSQASRVSG